MLFNDTVYGLIDVTEPVILELIDSPALQRLKDVNQFGYSAPYFPNTEHSRFEHSLGVYILLNKFNAPLEEQIAGLIHDISHSAFSHCIDYAFTNNPNIQAEQLHQDTYFDEYLIKTNIPQILEKHNFNYKKVINDNNHPLKENKLPALCADRIDYCLHDAVAYKEISTAEAQNIVNSLVVKDNQWIFLNYSAAKTFADLFFKINNSCWSGIKSAVMLGTVGQYLGYAVEKKYISMDNLYTTDTNVLKVIAQYHALDKKLEHLFDRMNLKYKYTNNPEDFDLKIGCKNRNVDPLFLDDNTIKNISEVDLNWKNIVNNIGAKVYYIKFAE